tara:strand:- start:51 stop:575 length:525 start_codon:yes stop_codon:yes gene_type:complete
MASIIRGDDNFDTAATGVLLSTSVATTSGTSIDFTGIPVGVKRLTVVFSAVGTSGTSHMVLRIGDSTISTSGYDAQGGYLTTAGSNITSTTSFPFYSDNASWVLNGSIVFNLVSGNTWSASYSLGGGTAVVSSGVSMFGGGTKTLSSALSKLRLTTINGSQAFNAGSVNVSWEF